MTDILEVLEFFGATFPEGVFVIGEEVEYYCPFCADATSHRPAGRANVLKNVCHCFACGVGGSPRTLLDKQTTIEVVSIG
jgi:hypothetical protein